MTEKISRIIISTLIITLLLAFIGVMGGMTQYIFHDISWLWLPLCILEGITYSVFIFTPIKEYLSKWVKEITH